MDIGIREDRRIWFVLDELSALGKLPALSNLMTEGRKYGACVVSGLQSLNQLYGSYGQYEGSTIFGQFGTNFYFRNNEPAIAKMVSSICGKETIYRQQKNTSYGAHEYRDGVSYSEQQQQKDLVEYSDLASLSTGECLVLLPDPAVRIAKLQTPEVKLNNKNAGFVEGGIIPQGLDLLEENSQSQEEVQKQDNAEQQQSNLQSTAAEEGEIDTEVEEEEDANEKSDLTAEHTLNNNL